ncbi:MAG: Uncharacterized protein Athens071425_438 [Parcubacteria group bacterium Athens0714_25]|nr:MAG: Uncharacterized protein Athens071425_438 [Parcubacteria group bacterium Athens0714_25]
MPHKIILSITILFVLSCFFLAWSEQKQYQQGSNQWFLSFENPQNSDLSFVIENQGSAQTFHWEYWINEKKISQGDEKIKNAEKKFISIPFLSSDSISGKNSIKTSSDGKTSEIYKIF